MNRQVKYFFVLVGIFQISIVRTQTLAADFVNPQRFQKKTVVHYSLPAADTVSLNVYNRWGQLILPVFTNSILTSGTYHDTIYMDNYPDEFYALVLKLRTGSFARNIVKDKNDKVKPLIFAGAIFDFQVDSAYKIYPYSDQKTPDIKTPETDFPSFFTFPKNQRNSILITNPVRQIAAHESRRLSYLTIKTDDEKYNPGTNAIKGTIENSAIVGIFRNILVTITYYSNSGTILETHDEIIKGPLNSGSSIKFQFSHMPPLGTTKYITEIRGANTVVNKKKLNNASAIRDLITDYPLDYYNTIIDYVSVNISAICEGKLEHSEGTNELLTQNQSNLLKKVDAGTTVDLKISFKYKNPENDDLGSKRKIKEMKYAINISE